MRVFYRRLQNKKSKKAGKGEVKPFGNAHLNKIMTHITAYIKRLSNNAKLDKLVPADIPNCKVTKRTVAYLTKDEVSLLMKQLEQNVSEANLSGRKHAIYSAYLRRAIVRMLYTT